MLHCERARLPHRAAVGVLLGLISLFQWDQLNLRAILGVFDRESQAAMLEVNGGLAKYLPAPALESRNIGIIIGGDTLKVADICDEPVRHTMDFAFPAQEHFQELDDRTEARGQGFCEDPRPKKSSPKGLQGSSPCLLPTAWHAVFRKTMFVSSPMTGHRLQWGWPNHS